MERIGGRERCRKKKRSGIEKHREGDGRENERIGKQRRTERIMGERGDLSKKTINRKNITKNKMKKEYTNITDGIKIK